jgi:hypothetical protein
MPVFIVRYGYGGPDGATALQCDALIDSFAQLPDLLALRDERLNAVAGSLFSQSTMKTTRTLTRPGRRFLCCKQARQQAREQAATAESTAAEHQNL